MFIFKENVNYIFIAIVVKLLTAMQDRLFWTGSECNLREFQCEGKYLHLIYFFVKTKIIYNYTWFSNVKMDWLVLNKLYTFH